MNHPKAFFKILTLSFGLTALGYIADSDPPYDNMQDTVMEFVILTGFIFSISAILYWFSTFYKNKTTL